MSVTITTLNHRHQPIRKALFLDRDGVINEDRNYVHRVEDFVLISGVIEAVRLAKECGYIIVVISNQAGIAKGYYGLSDAMFLHAHMQAIFAKAGASIDAVYICPHHPEGIVPEYTVICSCRKPKPGMLFTASKQLGINLKKSVLVGDKQSDIEAGVAAGVGKTCLVGSSSDRFSFLGGRANFEVLTLYQAVIQCCID